MAIQMSTAWLFPRVLKLLISIDLFLKLIIGSIIASHLAFLNASSIFILHHPLTDAVKLCNISVIGLSRRQNILKGTIGWRVNMSSRPLPLANMARPVTSLPSLDRSR